jgi:hypothetical protein
MTAKQASGKTKRNPMVTTQQIADAFNAAGLTTAEQVNAVVADLARNLALARIDIQLAALGQKQTDALAPIVNERIELQNKRAEIVALLKPVEIKG